MDPVNFFKFRNNGSSFKGRTLGAQDTFGLFLNAVELTFKVTDSTVYQRYRNLKPVQWAGPEAIWIQIGIEGFWVRHKSSQGTGADGPEDENVQVTGPLILYYDNPGVTVGILSQLAGMGALRIHVVQNFTGWIVGYPVGGGDAQRLCEVAAWYSTVSIVKSGSSWGRNAGLCGASTGWANTSVTPPAPTP